MQDSEKLLSRNFNKEDSQAEAAAAVEDLSQLALRAVSYLGR